MRFRLGTTGAEQGYDGIGNSMRNLMALPMLRAQAEGEAQTDSMKQQLLAAQTAEHAAKAEAERTQLQRGGIGELLKSAALQRGVPLHQVDEAAQYLQSGQLPQKYEMAPTLPGPTMPKPQYADPGVGAKIMETLGLTRQALTVGDKNVHNIAAAAGAYQDQGITQQAVDAAGRGDDMAMSRLNAVRGKKEFTPYSAIGNHGLVTNQVTGQANVADAGMRTLFGDTQNAGIRKDNAAATNSLASAGQHRATTDKVRQDIELGGKGVLQQTDQGLLLVNPRNATSIPVIGRDGRPVGKPGGTDKPMNGDQSKANMFGGRMTEANAILDELEDAGVYRPGGVKTLLEGVAGAVPLVGDSLREGAGAATNWTQSSKQQQVDQARRDFINAVLRRESGAAIAPSEFANADKQYFPQVGDSKEVLAQKRRNRQIATTLMLQEVPEVHRYKPKPKATQPTGGNPAPEGSWDAPAAPGGRTVKVDY